MRCSISLRTSARRSAPVATGWICPTSNFKNAFAPVTTAVHLTTGPSKSQLATYCKSPRRALYNFLEVVPMPVCCSAAPFPAWARSSPAGRKTIYCYCDARLAEKAKTRFYSPHHKGRPKPFLHKPTSHWLTLRLAMSGSDNKRCPVCKSLEGQPAEVEPPEEVREQAHYFSRTGSWQVYRCRPCGAEWQRFVPEEVGIQSGAWKALKIGD